MSELDENQHQEAIRKGLLNSTMTYKEILGSDWKEKLMQTKEEIDWFKKNSLPHAAYQLISGGEATGVDVVPTNDETEVGKSNKEDNK